MERWTWAWSWSRRSGRAIGPTWVAGSVGSPTTRARVFSTNRRVNSVGDRVGDEEAFGAHAALPGVVEAGADRGGGGGVQVGVVEDDERVGSAEFEDGFFDRAAGGGADGGAGAVAAGEGDRGDPVVSDDLLADPGDVGFGDDQGGRAGPAGNPARSTSCWIASALPVTFGECLSRTALPAARVGMATRMTCQNGKFHGITA